MDSLVITPRRSFGMFVGGMLVLLAVMSYQVSDSDTGRSVLGNVLFRVFSPVHAVIAGAFRGVAGTVQTYFSLTQTNRENIRLAKENVELKIRLAASSQLQEENRRLRQILQLRERMPYKLIAGEVIGRDAKASVSGTLTVNRGSLHGVKKEMPVVGSAGVVGTTIHVEPRTSRVLLITDAAASIGAMLQKDRVGGLLTGQGAGRCVLKLLPINAVFQKGDLVITSGQEGMFPEGLPVGRVAAEFPESEFYRSAEVTPFENFSSLTEVVFITEQVNPASHTAALPAEPGQQ